MMSGISRSCLVTHRPTSVEPASSTACGWAARAAASSSMLRGAWKVWPLLAYTAPASRCSARNVVASALGTAFLGAGAMQIFPQVLEDGLGGRDLAHLMNGPAVEESDRCGHCCLGFNPAC